MSYAMSQLSVEVKGSLQQIRKKKIWHEPLFMIDHRLSLPSIN